MSHAPCAPRANAPTIGDNADHHGRAAGIDFHHWSLTAMRFLSFPALLGTLLMSLGTLNAQADVGRFYDPSNAASPTGKTIGLKSGAPARSRKSSPCSCSNSRETRSW